jgi:protein KRI1
LHDYWNDPKLDESEKFLRDYILNKRYLDKDDDGEDGDDDDDEVDVRHEQVVVKTRLDNVDPVVVDLSEDEAIMETQENFEKKYNFRFEEPDAEFIKSYPRTINDTVRRKENKRKIKRDEYKKRKEAEKEKKREEIKRLKNLKKQEILDKIEKIKKITGNDDINLDIDDLDKDFDAAEYDKRMQEIFDGKFYHNNPDETKPEFSDSDPDVGSNY